MTTTREPRAHARRRPDVSAKAADRPIGRERIQARRVEVARDQGRRRLRVVVALGTVAALVALGLAVLHSSLFSARNVSIVGARHTSEKVILATSGLADHPPLIDLNPAAMSTALDRLPWVASASVARHWPSSVTLTIAERVPVATVAAGRGRVGVVDRSGRLLALTARPPAGLVSLAGAGPLPAVGGSVSPTGRQLAAVASQLPARFVGQIRALSSNRSDGIVVTLTDGIRVLFGSIHDLRQKVITFATVLAQPSQSLSKIVTIDLKIPAEPVLTG